ncbi:MAG: hypothetical protein E7K04_04900 [Helicobacter sp.]|nr:hypothetical protein [Helicobacter sp.]
MKIKYYILFVALFLSACAVRKDFTPKEISGDAKIKSTLSDSIAYQTKTFALLSNNDVLSPNGDIKALFNQSDLNNGASFINQSGGYDIYTPNCKEIVLSKDGEDLHFPTSSCALNASVNGEKLAFISKDNSFGIYDIKTQKLDFSDKGANASAINALSASPIFDPKDPQKVLFPLLDGKVVEVKNNAIIKSAIVSSDTFFSNVIFLGFLQDLPITATSKRLLVLNTDNSFEANIQDVALSGDKIYVLTLDGKIIELDKNVKKMREIRLPYAILSSPIIKNNKLFALEKGGFLISVDLASFKLKVYEVRNKFGKHIPNKFAFYSKNRLFYDYYELDLNDK